jgi:hypothetical protein
VAAANWARTAVTSAPVNDKRVPDAAARLPPLGFAGVKGGRAAAGSDGRCPLSLFNGANGWPMSNVFLVDLNDGIRFAQPTRPTAYL